MHGLHPSAPLMMAALLVGCPSANEPPDEPRPEDVSASPAAASSSTTADASAPGPRCRATLIRREGLATDDAACAAGIARLEALDGDHFACQADADCRLLEVAGGCLGINAGKDARIDPLPACGKGPCASSTFDDHRIRCEAGCCLIYEE